MQTKEDSNVIRLKCPQCGANTELREADGRRVVTCPYCGYSEVRDREPEPESREEHDARLQQLIREREQARAQAERDFSRQQNAPAKKVGRILLAVLALPVVIGLVLGIYSSVFGDPARERVDPFQNADVAFSGVDGFGKVSVSGVSGVRYSCDGDGMLREGETVTVRAESDTFNLTEKRREYTVTGLDLYVTDSAQVTDAMLEMLRTKTAEAISKEFDATGSMLSSATKHYEHYEWEEKGLYFVTDGEDENHLIEAVEMTFTRGEDSVTAYAAYELEDVIIRRNSISAFTWEDSGFLGGFIDIGSITSGSNGAFGSYMGIMQGFESEAEIERWINGNYAHLNKLQRL